ncbi:hypothetical protein [Streptomyces sp. NPDC005435]|uniref:hypothetical protein n=1 Tax=Streptomyces sp. NPDC005435 TaxID=3154464 RepID=UPI003451B602
MIAGRTRLEEAVRDLPAARVARLGQGLALLPVTDVFFDSVTDGTVVLGPLHLDEDEPFPAGGTPVSRALRHLGVVARAGQDEFEAAGLGRRRSSEDWLA